MSSSKVVRILTLTAIAIVAVVFLLLVNGSTRYRATVDLDAKVKKVNFFEVEPDERDVPDTALTSGAHNASLTVKASDAQRKNRLPAKKSNAAQKRNRLPPTTRQNTPRVRTGDDSNGAKNRLPTSTNEAEEEKESDELQTLNEDMERSTSTARPAKSSQASMKSIPKKGSERNGREKDSPWKTDIDNLIQILTDRLKVADVRSLSVHTPCELKKYLANSCDKGKKCLRTQLPTDVKGRITQLTNPPKLKLTDEIQNVLQEMGEKVEGQYDVILLTGASSNHFFESQAMIKSAHENVFPYFKNFKFLFYNLGLTPEEREAMVQHCKCQVLDFPFEKFPEFMRNLKCYSWKPVMIKAHVKQANVLIWGDASVRFHNDSVHLNILVQNTRERGLQIGGSNCRTPFRTYRNMYHYFGDEPCIYLKMGQAKATVGFYGRDPFVDRAILEPWAACAVNEACMCRKDPGLPARKGCAESKRLEAEWAFRNGRLVYGLCHRFDQSAISLILHKLYQDKYRWVMVDVLKYLDFRRKQTTVYFPD